MIPQPGKVSIHVRTISLTTPKSIADKRLTAPTPIIAVVLVCVVLTGMGADGTEGIKTLSSSRKKIHVIAQDEDSSVVYGMPKAIANAGLVDEVVPLDKIAETITKNVGVS